MYLNILCLSYKVKVTFNKRFYGSYVIFKGQFKIGVDPKKKNG